jgi:transposase
MPEIRKKYDREFREGAVRIVEETGKPIAQVARDLGVNEGTLGNWVARAREARNGTEGLSTGDIEELKRLWLTRPVGASAPARVNPGPTGAR